MAGHAAIAVRMPRTMIYENDTKAVEEEFRKRRGKVESRRILDS